MKRGLWSARPARAVAAVRVPVWTPIAARKETEECSLVRKVLLSPVSAKYATPLLVRDEDTPRGVYPVPARAVNEVFPLWNDFPSARELKERYRSGVLCEKDKDSDGCLDREKVLLPPDRRAGITADEPVTESDADAWFCALFCTVSQIAVGTPSPNSLSGPGSPTSTAHSLSTENTSSAVSQSWDR